MEKSDVKTSPKPSPSPMPSAPASQQTVDALKHELDKKSKELEDYSTHLKRLQADFENYIKRAEKDRTSTQDMACERIITKLLTVLDDSDRASKELQTHQLPSDLKKGLEMVFTNIRKMMESEGVRAIPTKGQKLDPFKHEVLLNEERSDVEDSTILEELQKGYELKGKVIRYSKVKVAKAKTQENNKPKQ